MDYTLCTAGCRAEVLSGIWSVDSEPVWVFTKENHNFTMPFLSFELQTS